MTGRERILAALEHREADRVPRYIWVDGGEATRRIVERFGSYDAFLDALDVDMFQAFPDSPTLIDVGQWREAHPAPPRQPGLSQGALSLDEALAAPLTDPNREAIYAPIEAALAHHQQAKGRAVFVQTPGCFETANGLIGMDGQLMEMALRPEFVRALYRKQLEWTKVYIANCLALGADVIHISDDLGQNGRMLFSPATFREVVAPVLAAEARFVRERSPHLSLHSCGYFDDIIGDLADMGFDCLHPIQESAGMDLVSVKRRFGRRVTLYGGLDVRATLPSGDRELIRKDIERVVTNCKRGGGLIFCTAHTVHQDCSLDDVLYAYELLDEYGAY